MFAITIMKMMDVFNAFIVSHVKELTLNMDSLQHYCYPL